MTEVKRKAAYPRDPKKTYPIVARGEGVYIYDREGNKYLDSVGGAKVVNIGHGVVAVADAMQRQASQIAFAYTGHFLNEPQMKLAERVLSLAPANMASVYFTCGGSEAVEVAIKMARQYHLSRGERGRYKVIGIWQSYHGATMGALAVGGQTKRRVDNDPYLKTMPHIPPPFCYRCPYGQVYGSCRFECAHALESIIEREGPETISAFIAEPVSGSSAAAVTPPPEFFPLVSEICNRYRVLLICDEVITGFGRTGANFGIMHTPSVTPDLMICGKGISSGYAPLGAVILKDRVYDVLADSPSFFMGYTCSGHAVCCAAGLAVQEYIEQHNLFARVNEMGSYLQKRLQQFNSMAIVGEVRCRGLLAGIEFVADKEKKTPFPREKKVQEQIVSLAYKRRVFIGTGSGGIATGLCGDDIGLCPPFIIEKKEIDLLTDVLADCIIAVSQQMGL